MAVERSVRWRRRGVALVAVVALCVLGSTWLASSRTGVYDVGATGELLIVNDAGPVRVRSLDAYDGAPEDLAAGGVLVRSAESWLLRGPKIEQLTEGDASAFRITCPSRLPCRASIEVFVPHGVDLSIVAANDVVQIDSFDGAMSVFAGEGGVTLGSVTGSVSIVSEGPVQGTSLGPSELTVDVVDADVSLTYLEAPTILAVVSGDGDVVIELPMNESYALAVEAGESVLGLVSDPSSDRLVSIRSAGSVSIESVGSIGDS